MTKLSPFRYFKTSPDIIRLAVMMYVRFPRSLRNLEDLLHERGIEINHETVRFWWNRLGPLFAAEIRKQRVSGIRTSRWHRHLDEVFVKINGRSWVRDGDRAECVSKLDWFTKLTQGSFAGADCLIYAVERSSADKGSL